MKTTNFKILILTCLLSLFTIASCDKIEDNSNNISQTEVQSNIQNGSWRITKFIDSGVEETNYFTGYTFTFNTSGELIANNGTNTYMGTWSITDSNSDDDSKDDSPNDLDFNIFFNTTNDFEDLNDDWDFITQSSTKIELLDISGGNGGTDYLTFEKN